MNKISKSKSDRFDTFAYPLIVASVLFFMSCGDNPTSVQFPRSFPVIQAELRTVEGDQVFPATLQGTNNNDIRAKIQGYITQVLIDEGQSVRRGQPLFRLETNTLSENASAAQSGVEAAKANVHAAQVEVDKLKPLVERNIISSIQLETAEAALLVAKSQLAQAKANYNSAAENVKYAVITSPIDGIVGKINLRQGSLVGPADPTPITSVSDTKRLYAYFSMNESEYLNFLEVVPGTSIKEKLNNIPPVTLELANNSTYPIRGKVETVTGQIDPQTGTMQFRALFDNSNGILANGNSGRIHLPQQFINAVVIPESATFEQQGKTYAYKVENDTARTVIIEVESRINNLALVKKGVDKSDKIVANGVGNLKSGTAITPVIISIDSITNSLKSSL